MEKQRSEQRSWNARGLAVGKGTQRSRQRKAQSSQTYKVLERAGWGWCLTEETDGERGRATGREETISGNTLDSWVTGHHNEVSSL